MQEYKPKKVGLSSVSKARRVEYVLTEGARRIAAEQARKLNFEATAAILEDYARAGVKVGASVSYRNRKGRVYHIVIKDLYVLPWDLKDPVVLSISFESYLGAIQSIPSTLLVEKGGKQ